MSDENDSNYKFTKFGLDRLFGLSDGVIAIAITLLVLGIDIPDNHSFSEHGIISFLIKLEPGLLAYLTSFLIVAIYWIQHHRILNVAMYGNRTLLVFNIIFLFAISLIPFVSKMKSMYHYDLIVITIFGLTHVFTGLVLFFTWRYLMKHPELLKEKSDIQYYGRESLSILLIPIICLFAIGVSFIDVHIGTYTFMLVPVGYLVVNKD